MPTVNSIAKQIDLTADVSAKFFRTDFEAATKSVLVTGPMTSAADMLSSNFGLRSNISEMLGDYQEQKESFNSELDKTLASLRESTDKFQQSLRDDEEQKVAVRVKSQESEYARRKSAETFADAARDRVEENQQARRKEAEQIAAVNLERIQNTTRTRREETEPITVAARERVEETEQTLTARTEQLADATRQRTQETTRQLDDVRDENINADRRNLRTQRDITERFAQQYLVAEETAQRNETDAVQRLTLTRDENANAALSNVRNLVARFNDAVNYFNENRGLSNRMSALAGTFDNAGRFAESLNAVGISVDNGRLTVNESRLADALNRNSSDVQNALGRNGLAGQLDRSLELADAQRDNLFPTVADYLNDRRTEPTESLYAAQLNQTAALARVTGANFVNMFT